MESINEEHIYVLMVNDESSDDGSVDESCITGGDDEACSTFESLAHSSPLWGGSTLS